MLQLQKVTIGKKSKKLKYIIKTKESKSLTDKDIQRAQGQPRRYAHTIQNFLIVFPLPLNFYNCEIGGGGGN